MNRNKFVQNMSNATFTENNDVAYKSTLNSDLDLFLKIGIRNDSIVRYYNQATEENRLKILLYSRDALKGMGLRYNYLKVLSSVYSADNKIQIILHAIQNGIGYWKDMFNLYNASTDLELTERIENVCLLEFPKQNNGLFFKWFPRKGKLRKAMEMRLEMSPREFRKLIVSKSHTVEQNVCAKDFESINYSHVPGKAMKRHLKTFQKFDTERYAEYLKAIERGEAKMNTGTLMPYEVYMQEEIWKNLPNLFEGLPQNYYFPIIDCSGSMCTNVLPNVSALRVAHSLGLYIAEHNVGVFHNTLMTFSRNPHFITFIGSFMEKRRQLDQNSEVANTNLGKVFQQILYTAVEANIPVEDIPKSLLLISDGQFDSMVDGESTLQASKRMFAEKGLPFPEIVFWNVSAKTAIPFTIRDSGVVCLSGMSPNVLKLLVDGGDAVAIMNKAISDPRYNLVLE